ncbi:MAG: lysine--tRNA ligase, partial [Candidatus Aenigmatarchaeota archaeon]
GKRMIEEIFDREAPHPVIYEWIQLKGEGPMSSSSGVSIKTEEMLDMISPEIVRFLIMRSKPNTHIDFDPGLGLLDLVDEYDKYEEVYFEDGDEDKARTYELSQVDSVPEREPQRIPYRHLVNLVQIYDEKERIWKVAKDTGLIEKDDEEDFQRFEERAENVRFWLDNYAPDMVKFSLEDELPDVKLEEDEKEFLRSYSKGLAGTPWKAEELHQLVHESAEKNGINKGRAFRSFYKILLGKNKGPRLGRFLSQLDEDFVKERIDEALKD